MKHVLVAALLVFLAVGSLYATQKRSARHESGHATRLDAALEPETTSAGPVAFASTTDIDELLPCRMQFEGEIVVVEELPLGKMDSGRLGFAYLVATRSGGQPFIIDDAGSYDVVSSNSEDLFGAIVPSTIPGESRRIDELPFAVDEDNCLYISYWKGSYIVSETEFTIDYGGGFMADPICCKLRLGIPNCVDRGCDGSGGACDSPPYTCACVGGTGMCLSGAAIQMCYGNCGVPGCNAGQCAHWIDPEGVERCGCRSS